MDTRRWWWVGALGVMWAGCAVDALGGAGAVDAEVGADGGVAVDVGEAAEVGVAPGRDASAAEVVEAEDSAGSGEEVGGVEASWQVFPAEACSVSCGAGVQAVHVVCVAEGVPVDGVWCAGEEPPPDEAACEAGEPACGWGAWGAWGACSAACGGGVRRRERSCEVEGWCAGEAFEEEACNAQACCMGDVCGAWSLQPKCNCDTGKRCNVRTCTRCDGSTYRGVGSCRTDCPNGCI